MFSLYFKLKAYNHNLNCSFLLLINKEKTLFPQSETISREVQLQCSGYDIAWIIFMFKKQIIHIFKNKITKNIRKIPL